MHEPELISPMKTLSLEESAEAVYNEGTNKYRVLSTWSVVSLCYFSVCGKLPKNENDISMLGWVDKSQ